MQHGGPRRVHEKARGAGAGAQGAVRRVQGAVHVRLVAPPPPVRRAPRVCHLRRAARDRVGHGWMLRVVLRFRRSRLVHGGDGADAGGVRGDAVLPPLPAQRAGRRVLLHLRGLHDHGAGAACLTPFHERCAILFHPPSRRRMRRQPWDRRIPSPHHLVLCHSY